MHEPLVSAPPAVTFVPFTHAERETIARALRVYATVRDAYDDDTGRDEASALAGRVHPEGLDD